MSQWTHVNAVIRFDGIKGRTPDPNLGYTYHYNDPPENSNRCDVPCGSEGSLQYKLIELSGEGLVRFVAVIWGDLRDYNDVEVIEEYLKRITKSQLIRSGIAEIVVERGKTRVLRYNQEKEDWETILEENDE